MKDMNKVLNVQVDRFMGKDKSESVVKALLGLPEITRLISITVEEEIERVLEQMLPTLGLKVIEGCTCERRSTQEQVKDFGDSAIGLLRQFGFTDEQIGAAFSDSHYFKNGEGVLNTEEWKHKCVFPSTIATALRKLLEQRAQAPRSTPCGR